MDAVEKAVKYLRRSQPVVYKKRGDDFLFPNQNLSKMKFYSEKWNGKVKKGNWLEVGEIK